MRERLSQAEAAARSAAASVKSVRNSAYEEGHQAGIQSERRDLLVDLGKLTLTKKDHEVVIKFITSRKNLDPTPAIAEISQ